MFPKLKKALQFLGFDQTSYSIYKSTTNKDYQLLNQLLEKNETSYPHRAFQWQRLFGGKVKTPLEQAVENNDLKAMRILLSHNAPFTPNAIGMLAAQIIQNPDAPQTRDITSLKKRCYHNFKGIVKVLKIYLF